MQLLFVHEVMQILCVKHAIVMLYTAVVQIKQECV